MNKDSSRSHSIFTIYIENMEEAEARQIWFTLDLGCRSRVENQSRQTTLSRLSCKQACLISLQGSERQSKTHATGDRLKEAQKINLSLSVRLLSESLGAWKRNQCVGGRKIYAHPVQRFQADKTITRLAWRKHKDCHDRSRVAS